MTTRPTRFTVTAESGNNAWTWLALDPEDSPDSIIIFDDNGFLLRRGETKLEVVGCKTKGGTRPSNANCVGRVTVQSIWNNTLAD